MENMALYRQKDVGFLCENCNKRQRGALFILGWGRARQVTRHFCCSMPVPV